MSLWNRNVIAAIAVLFSIGAASGVIGRPMSHAASAEMQGFQSRPATRSSAGRVPIFVASQDDDWTAWGGAYRDSPALRHSN